jgi:hypothetical protein
LGFLFSSLNGIFGSVISIIKFFIWNWLMIFFKNFFLQLFFGSFFFIIKFSFEYFYLLLLNFRFSYWSFDRIYWNLRNLIFNRDIFSKDSLFVINFFGCLFRWTLFDYSFFNNLFYLFYSGYFFNNCNRDIMNSVNF